MHTHDMSNWTHIDHPACYEATQLPEVCGIRWPVI